VKPNYFAVIFSSSLKDQTDPIYHEFSNKCRMKFNIVLGFWVWKVIEKLQAKE